MKITRSIVIVVICLTLTSCGAINSGGCGLTSDSTTSPKPIEFQENISSESV